MKRIFQALLCIAVTFGFSCASSREETTPIDPRWNDIACFLAGLPVRSGSAFEQAASSAVYREHSAFMNSFWERVEKENIGRIRPWRDSNVPAGKNLRLAMYPFSGADFVNLYTLYPRCAEYLMIALEEPGHVPDLLSLKPYELSSGLASLRRVMSSIATQNYFKSAVMRQEMTNPYIEGTVPVLLIFTVRLGNRITSVEPVAMDDAGKIETCVPDGTAGHIRPAVTGCRIYFIAPGERKRRVLTYLRMCLGRESVDPVTPTGKFFNALPRFGMVTKSAVYLLNTEALSGVCRYFLDKSDIIIQDDSGIPYRMFEPAKWQISLFGMYTHPPYISDLSNPPVQGDLAVAYKNVNAPLDFNFGYGVLAGSRKSNLLCAVRIK